MKNFDEKKIEEIKSAALSFYSIIDDTDNWVNRNLENEQQESVSIKLKNKRRTVRKIIHSIDSKPVFALFGGSQVGKSYLIKNILSISGAPLKIQLGQSSIDFLKDINPPGTGAESTGVVTRFTIDKVSNFEDYPIRSKLLNTKDLILIICDSFFSDLKSIEYYPTEQEFSNHIINLKNNYGSNSDLQKVLVEDDIFDIKEYFDKNFNHVKFYTNNISSSHYWFEIGKIISKITAENWHEAISILWNKNKSFTDLFNLLIKELKSIGFASELYLKSETVLRGQGEILDVQRLKEIFSEASSTSVKNSDGNAFDVNISIVSALSREVSLVCDGELADEKPFMKNTDLLDFPGARGRLEHTMESISVEAIPDLYLRGKVSYLFNKYSGDFEINNLLFCQNDKQLDVNELPTLLNDWISNNIGSDAQVRGRNLSNLPVSPLFIIFTFFNNQLKFDTTNDDKEDISYKWNTRFHRFFEQELVTVNYNWHKNWTADSPLFKNFYMLRDYKYSSDTFDGFEESGQEKGILEQRVDFLNKVRASFIDHEFVQKHFENPETSFDQAALPNQDGGELIIQNLVPAANNYVKINNYLSQLDQLKGDFIQLMSKFHYTDDLDVLRKRAISDSLKVQLEMNRIFSNDQEKFDRFLEIFMLSEISIFNYLHENLRNTVVQEGSTSEYELFKSSFPDLSDKNSKEKNLDIIRASLGLSTVEDVISILQDQGMEVDKLFPQEEKSSSIDAVLEGIYELWHLNITEKHIDELISIGFTADAIKIIRETYERAFKFNEFNPFLKAIIKEKYQGISLESEAEKYLAAVISQYFNEFIGQFGINDLELSVFENVKTLQPQLSTFLDGYLMEKPLPSDVTLEELFNKLGEEKLSVIETNALIGGYNDYLSKFKTTMLSNCGFVHYDIDENNILSDLIQKTSGYKFLTE